MATGTALRRWLRWAAYVLLVLIPAAFAYWQFLDSEQGRVFKKALPALPGQLVLIALVVAPLVGLGLLARIEWLVRKQTKVFPEEIKRLKKERDGLGAQAKTFMSAFEQKGQALDLERAAREAAEASAEDRWNQIHYDIALPKSFDKLSETQLVVANNDLKKVRPSLTGSGRAAFELAKLLLQDMKSGDERNQVIARYFEERRLRTSENLYDRLGDELKVHGENFDYRVWLTHYYEAYNELRRTIAQMARFTGCSLAGREEYRKWRTVDETFLAKIGDIGAMTDIIAAVNLTHRYPLPMPPVTT